MISTLSSYGVFGAARLFRDLLFTRLAFRRGARLIRLPFYCRGAGRVTWGERLTTGVAVRIDAFGPKGCLQIGDRVQVNDNVHIAAIEKVVIGNDVLIASRVFIADHNHGRYDAADPQSAPHTRPEDRPLQSRPVVIGDRVWIGENVCILPGVTIGEGSIVAAGSVVTKDVGQGVIVAGAPARPVRVFNAEGGSWEKI